MSSEKHYIRSSIPIRVVSASYAKNTKVKILEVHPVKPWILFADSITGKITLFDYFLNSERSCFSVYSLHASQKSKSLSPPPIDVDINFLFRRISRKMNCDIDVGPIPPPSVTKDVNVDHNSNSNISKSRSIIGTIRQVLFTDLSTMSTSSSNCYTSENIFNSKQSSDFSVNASVGVAVVCEFQIIFLDLLTFHSHAVTVGELLSTKTNPNMSSSLTITTATVLKQEVLAVGLSDGSLRLWDRQRNRSLKNPNPVMAHNRSTDIVTIKTIGKQRFVSLGSDGCVVLWQWQDSSSSSLKEEEEEMLFDVIALARTGREGGGVSGRMTMFLDVDGTSLFVMVSEKLVKIWDLTSTSTSSNTNNKVVKQPLKRSSLSFLSPSSSSSVSEQQMCSIPLLGQVKPAKSLPMSLQKMSSITPIATPGMLSGLFLVSSKTGGGGGGLALVQRQSSSSSSSLGVDNEDNNNSDNDKSSVASTSVVNEHADRLLLLQEMSLQTMMETFFASHPHPHHPHSHSKDGKDVKEDVKIYSLTTHPSQPHLVVVATSIGVVVLSLQSLPVGPLTGHHHLWRNLKLAMSDSSLSVKKISLELSSSSSSLSSSSVGSFRVGSWRLNRVSTLEDISSSVGTAVTGEGIDLSLSLSSEVLEEIPLNFFHSNNTETGTTTSRPRTSSQSQSVVPPPQGGIVRKTSGMFDHNRNSLVRRNSNNNNNNNNNHNNIRYLKPLLHPSPSGRYCAVEYPDMNIFFVLQMSPQLLVVDQGMCVGFAWIGLSDHFLIKTPPAVSISKGSGSGVAGTKRSSLNIGDLLFSNKKETRVFVESTLQLRSVSNNGVSKEEVIRLRGEGVTSTNTIDLFGGLLLGINTNNNKDNNKETMTMDPDKEVDRQQRRVAMEQKPPRHLLTFHFFCLATGRDAIEMTMEKHKDHKGNKTNKTTKNSSDHVNVEGMEQDGFALVSIGPTMRGVEMVQWDYTTGQVAVLLTGSMVNILQLSRCRLESLVSVDVGPGPIPMHVCVSNLYWWTQGGGGGGCLLVNTNRAIQVVSLIQKKKDNTSGWCVDVFPLKHTMEEDVVVVVGNNKKNLLPFSSNRGLGGSDSCVWSELVGMQKGMLFLSYRDNSMKCLSLHSNPLVPVILLANLMHRYRLAASDHINNNNNNNNNNDVDDFSMTRICSEILGWVQVLSPQDRDRVFYLLINRDLQSVAIQVLPTLSIHDQVRARRFL